MGVNLWILSAWLVAFALAFVIFREHRRSLPDFASVNASPARLEILAALVLIAVGLTLRLAFLGEFFGGNLTGDEHLATIITSTTVHGERTRDGATHLTMALGLDFWYQVFGFSPLAARALSAALGTISLIFFFLGLRRAAGFRLALWSTAFLSVSLYGIYFSKISFDIVWALSLPPVVFFFLISAWQNRSALLAASAGLVFSLGLFSYPGFMLATISVIAGMVISHLVYRRNAEPSWWRSSQWWIMTLAFITGAIPYAVFAVYQHFTALGAGGEPLLMGGGALSSFSISSILSGWYQVLYDALFSSSSWYLIYHDLAFFEIALLPLGVYGIYMFWRAGTHADREKRWMWYGLFLAIPILISMVPFTGPYPGMRRAVFVLLPYSIALGGGFIFLLNAILAQRTVPAIPDSGRNHLLYKMLGLSILILAVAHSITYQFGTGRDISRVNRGEGFVKPRIPYSFILGKLKSHDIVFDQAEFTGWFDGLIYTHYPRLYNRYNPEADIRHNVMVLPYDDLLKLSNKVLMIWDSGKFGQLVASGKVCVSPESMSSDVGVNLPYWGIFPPEGKKCDGSLDMEPGSEMDMRYDMALRLKHRFRCDHYCGPERSSFIYTHGGDVTFLLTPVSRDAPVLRLEVMNPATERESLIFVNDVFVGTLAVKALDETGKFADFPVPEKARLSTKSWAIRISPSADPHKLGWDIVKAKLHKN